MVVYSSSILLKCATMSYPSTHRLKYSNQTVSSLKYLEENQEICFYYHHQARFIHYFIKTGCHYYCICDSMQNLGQTRIIHKPGHTHSTQTKRDLVDTRLTRSGFNPAVCVHVCACMCVSVHVCVRIEIKSRY